MRKVKVGIVGAYRRSLGEGNRERVDDLFDQARGNYMAAGNTVRSVVFEVMFMAMASHMICRIEIV